MTVEATIETIKSHGECRPATRTENRVCFRAPDYEALRACKSTLEGLGFIHSTYLSMVHPDSMTSVLFVGLN